LGPFSRQTSDDTERDEARGDKKAFVC